VGKYKGGCSCGAVRFELATEPQFVVACHCKACKRRTGSAYGISVAVDSADVEAFEGEVRAFVRPGDSGRNVRYEFCPACATTLRWFVENLPNRVLYAGGAFDNYDDLKPVGEMYTADASDWARLACELSTPKGPDDAFRAKMAERLKRAAR
jgi:hypothetical protein